MSTLRMSSLSQKAQSVVNQSAVTVPKKNPLGSAFDSELSDVGHYSSKMMEATPKVKKERSQMEYSEKSKKLVLEPAFR